MSYDRDPERYSVQPDEIWGIDECHPCPIEIRWLVVDEYQEAVVADFTDAQEADAYCIRLNDNFNEEMGTRAQDWDN